jgi:anti-sigma-K factor RskA
VSRDADIAGYLLGELGPDERVAVERRMREDGDFRREVERLRAVVAELERVPPEAWDPEEVPPLPELPAPPAPPRVAPARRRWSAGWAAAAVAACLALVAAGVGIGALVFGGGDGGGTGPAIALARVGQGGPAASGDARAVSSDDGGLRVRVSGLAPSGPGDFYELWLLDGPERLLSLGSFRVPASGGAEVTVPLPVDVADFRFVDVSVEDDDGVPGHSGVSVLRGPTAPA